MVGRIEQRKSLNRGFSSRTVLLALASLALLALVGWLFFGGKGKSAAPAPPPVQMMNLIPPPPPPPPPRPRDEPRPEPSDVQEMVVQEMVALEEVLMDEPQAEAPSEAMGTNIRGDGSPDAFGLSSRGGGGTIGGVGSAGGLGRGQGSPAWGRYASQVQTAVADLIRQHPQTREASGRYEVRVWVDGNGRLTRVHLAGRRANDPVADAIENEILTGMQLQSAPPEDLPMPIIMRIQAQRPF